MSPGRRSRNPRRDPCQGGRNAAHTVPASKGLGLTTKKDARLRTKAAAQSVFRPYSGPGNIREELLKVASDNIIVEAHTAGAEDWTTLPDKNGRTSTTVPEQCEQGYYLDMHPFLGHYLTGGNPCGNTGTSGRWNAFTGNSNGWVPAAFDLSAYAGKKIEVSISYVSDPATGGTGLFVDDTRLTTSAGQLDAEGFETGLGP
ncbi:immune inhibitor A domain-containing protein [Actinomadura latina]|uniref:immune inhibitor A domain-containing protein n=1 Tax=Actinomadura latina TaxID=163603 RepID=UPI0008345DF4|nr:immune inhibitor A domain-containing protein [Actinomadura latina]